MLALDELKLGNFALGVVANESLDGEGLASLIPQNDPAVV